MKGLNRYISQEDAEAYVKVIDSVGITILKLTDSIGRMKYGLMTEPLLRRCEKISVNGLSMIGFKG